MGEGTLIAEAWQSHTDTPNVVGLLWAGDQSNAEISMWKHTTLKTTDIHTIGGIRTFKPSTTAAANLRPKPHSHFDRRRYVDRLRKQKTYKKFCWEYLTEDFQKSWVE